jgi:hypothetical protein
MIKKMIEETTAYLRTGKRMIFQHGLPRVFGICMIFDRAIRTRTRMRMRKRKRKTVCGRILTSQVEEQE